MIAIITAAITLAGGSYSPDSQRFAVRSSFPAMLARCAAVLMGHKSLATAANFSGGTTVSLSGL